jgi:hypothetical protein
VTIRDTNSKSCSNFDNFFPKKLLFFSLKFYLLCLNVLFVGYSLVKNNLNNTYQYNMISNNFSKTMNYLININKIQSESFFVPVSVLMSNFNKNIAKKSCGAIIFNRSLFKRVGLGNVGD